MARQFSLIGRSDAVSPGRILNLYVDGGSRGNPGPAAAAAVLTDQAGHVVHQGGYYLGKATNNVAEYQGLIRGLEAARRLGAAQVTVHSDSELLVRQMQGHYRVKAPHLQPLHQQAGELCRQFDSCRIVHVRREQNVLADQLVNQALDARRDVAGPAAV